MLHMARATLGEIELMIPRNLASGSDRSPALYFIEEIQMAPKRIEAILGFFFVGSGRGAGITSELMKPVKFLSCTCFKTNQVSDEKR